MPGRDIHIILVFFIAFLTAKGQEDSVNLNLKNRQLLVAGTSVALTGGSLIYLNQEWYAPYSTGKFHFFNDNAEWLQMDKAGHVFSTYQAGRLMMEAYDWAGFNKKYKLYA